jgi:agmatinase
MTQEQSIEKPFFGITTENINYANMLCLGIPWDQSSSYRKGATDGPAYLRWASSGLLFNPYTESNIDLRQAWQIFDGGDVPLGNQDPIADRKAIENAIRKYYQYNMFFMFLGGDHLTTYFCFRALKKLLKKRTGIIYIDAHPDLYEEYEQNKYSHACVVKRIVDEIRIDPSAIIEVGIRAGTPEQMATAQELGIQTISNADFLNQGPKKTAQQVLDLVPSFVEQVYLSIDLDILDPAYAPAVGNPQPGGLTTRQLIDFIHQLYSLPITAFDITELCPPYDQQSTTSYTAAKIIQETLGIMAKK